MSSLYTREDLLLQIAQLKEELEAANRAGLDASALVIELRQQLQQSQAECAEWKRVATEQAALHRDDTQKLEAECERLRGALEFYADEDRHLFCACGKFLADYNSPCPKCGGDCTAMDADRGEQARQALAARREGER